MTVGLLIHAPVYSGFFRTAVPKFFGKFTKNTYFFNKESNTDVFPWVLLNFSEQQKKQQKKQNKKT